MLGIALFFPDCSTGKAHMVLARVQPQLAHQEFKLLLQDSRIDYHKFITANAVGMLWKYSDDLLGSPPDKGISSFMALRISHCLQSV